ncbi:MAG: hypothetical protein HGJ94_00505 [Desulfosarcina sp.]|nr:hypothetical protein [Desulfosarcina sp.]MBC2744145.1 hypothetical protein [Desulfosarcina sp.]MBC2767054.1 hypothetical protein [Desulfosarcina sp.]
MSNDIQGEAGSLEALLDLNGEIYMMDTGYWVKIEAKRVSPSPSIPHGIRYSLTLHDRNNARVVGFDNAHAIKPKGRKRFSGRKVTWDHKHRMDKVEPYEFESAGHLLNDFWGAVDKQMGE